VPSGKEFGSKLATFDELTGLQILTSCFEEKTLQTQGLWSGLGFRTDRQTEDAALQLCSSSLPGTDAGPAEGGAQAGECPPASVRPAFKPPYEKKIITETTDMKSLMSEFSFVKKHIFT
jgi:hypothetical protein